MRLFSALKNVVTSSEIKPRWIRAGPFKGILMSLSLRTQLQICFGLYEKETHPWLNRLSRGISTAVDIGVAQGEHTLYFLKKTKANKIFAFEPDLLALPSLHDNLQLNGVDNSDRLEISTKFVGVSDTEQELRLDSLVQSLQAPCLVKMDVDGAEEQILKGATSFNSLPGVRWLIETHSRELEIACVGMLKAAGFQTRVIPNAWWRFFIPEQRPIAHNRWLAAWKNDELAVPLAA